MWRLRVLLLSLLALMRFLVMGLQVVARLVTNRNEQ